MRSLTRQELSRYDGRDGRAALVAFEGKVYDVSASFLWQGGRHQVLHQAGQDLTAALREAPHGGDLLERFPVVGMITRE